MKKKKDNIEPTLKSVKDVKSFFRYVFKGDDVLSHILYFGFLFVLFKFILIPIIGLLLHTSFPLTVIVSGSMEQDLLDGNVCGVEVEIHLNRTYWDVCGIFYENKLKISQNQFNNFSYSSGMNRGDVIVVYGKNPKNIKLGDVILFKGQDKVILENGEEESLFFLQYGPIIHRVIQITEKEDKFYFTTKGDNNPEILSKEINIPQEDVIGVAVLRIPYLGLLNYYFYEYVIAPLSNN